MAATKDYPPFAGFMNGCSVNALHMHRLNLAINQTDFINKVLLDFYPWETATSIANGQTQRGLIYNDEVL